jgi:hypothetical protein
VGRIEGGVTEHGDAAFPFSIGPVGDYLDRMK